MCVCNGVDLCECVCVCLRKELQGLEKSWGASVGVNGCAWLIWCWHAWFVPGAKWSLCLAWAHHFNVWYPSASYVCVIYFIVSISLYLFQSSISMYGIPVHHMCVWSISLYLFHCIYFNHLFQCMISQCIICVRNLCSADTSFARAPYWIICALLFRSWVLEPASNVKSSGISHVAVISFCNKVRTKRG
jgi:hypothetical protein